MKPFQNMYLQKSIVPFNWSPVLPATSLFEQNYPLNEIMISLQLKAMYNDLLNENWSNLKKHTVNIIQKIKSGRNITMSDDMKNMIFSQMIDVFALVAFNNRDDIHKKIRDMYFKIESKYLLK